MRELKEWVNRLYNDVLSEPIARKFQEHERAINQLTARLDGLPDEPISQTDVEVFSEGLEKLRTEILTQLEKESADKGRLEARIDDLSSDIDFLKQTLESMTKRKWGELLFARFNKWKSLVSPAQISAGTKVLNLLMPGGTFDVLDSVTPEIDNISDAADD